MSDTLMTSLEQLLQTPHPPGLGSGPRAHVAAPQLLADRLDELARHHGMPTRRRDLVQALVLLWHDHLHAAHAIVQELPDADAALIHAILHRREPDYWNAKYWLRRVGRHPIYPRLADAAAALAIRAGLASDIRILDRNGEWEDAAFVDFVQACAALAETDPRRRFAVTVQEAESRLLLEHLVNPEPPRAASTPA